MKKIVIINPILFLLFIIFFVGGCGNDNKFEKKSGEVSKSILNGLYNVEYEITDTNYIWVVSDDMIYTFYPGSENYINYESPTYYYINENKIYICGIGPDWGPVQLSECKKNKTEPSYIIISNETVLEPYSNDEIQVVTLKNFYSKKSIILKRKLY